MRPSVSAYAPFPGSARSRRIARLDGDAPARIRRAAGRWPITLRPATERGFDCGHPSSATLAGAATAAISVEIFSKTVCFFYSGQRCPRDGVDGNRAFAWGRGLSSSRPLAASTMPGRLQKAALVPPC